MVRNASICSRLPISQLFNRIDTDPLLVMVTNPRGRHHYMEHPPIRGSERRVVADTDAIEFPDDFLTLPHYMIERSGLGRSEHR